jgi:hypothetical protein
LPWILFTMYELQFKSFVVPLLILVHLKQVENVRYFNYPCSLIKSDATCTSEIISRKTVTELAFNKEKTLFISKLGLKYKEGTNKVLHLEHSFLWRWNLDNLESRSETPGKFWNVVLEKDGEEQLGGTCTKLNTRWSESLCTPNDGNMDHMLQCWYFPSNKTITIFWYFYLYIILYIYIFGVHFL